MDQERKRICWENGLILLAIAGLWPTILGWPRHISQPLLAVDLLVMLFVLRRRWRRLFSHSSQTKD